MKVRIQMGYKTIALKAIDKTLSMTMKVARFAYEHEIPCFCADLTVNPILVEWNKNVAARLKSFPGYFGNGSEDFSGDTFSRETGLKHSLESISGMLKAEKESEGRIMLAMFQQNEKVPKWK